MLWTRWLSLVYQNNCLAQHPQASPWREQFTCERLEPSRRRLPCPPPQRRRCAATVLIGPPASGKSTLARTLAPLLTAAGDSPALVLSTDAIRAEVFGDAAVQGPWIDIQQRLQQRLIEAVAAGIPVMIDATHARHVGPNLAEGFATLCAIVPTHHDDLEPLLAAELAALDRSIRIARAR